MIDLEQTIISQYANSNTLNAVLSSLNVALDQRANFKTFYDYVWNVDTAQNFGLDIWGRIVGLPNGRLLNLGANVDVFGFANADVPPDWAPFNQGTFYSGVSSSTTFELNDAGFRTLILAKALANITATTSPALNALLINLFPNRGRCYVVDGGKSNTAVAGMVMTFTFEFAISQVEYAILTQAQVMPHPGGVGFNVLVIPQDLIGFAQAPPAQPLSQGVLYVPPST